MKNIHTKTLHFAGALFLVVLSVLAISVTVFVMHGNKTYDENTISVSGTAKVSSTPDVATFSFTVKETSKEAKIAQDTINEKVSKILDGLNNLNVNKKDIKTESYTIYPKYEWVKVENKKETSTDGTIYFPGKDKKRVQVGFDVSQNIRVKLRNIENVSDVLTLFAQNGVEDLYGPNLEIDDLDSLREDARLEAIKEAKEKAKRLAKNLDVRLGKIVSFKDSSSGYQSLNLNRGNMKMVVGTSMDTVESYMPELPVGENDITVTVTITYKIK